MIDNERHSSALHLFHHFFVSLPVLLPSSNQRNAAHQGRHQRTVRFDEGVCRSKGASQIFIFSFSFLLQISSKARKNLLG